MRVLHVLSRDESLAPLSALYQQYDMQNEHSFLTTVPMTTVLKKWPAMLGIRGLQTIPPFKRFANIRSDRYVKREAAKADHVVWHSFSGGDGAILKLLSKDPALLAKSTWVVSNDEIDNLKSEKKMLRGMDSDRLHNYVYNHVGGIIVPFPRDQEHLRLHGIHQTRVTAIPQAIPPERLALLRRSMDEPRRPDVDAPNGRLLVQVGLNMLVRNRHLDILSVVQTMENKGNIVLFMPDHYGMDGMSMSGGSKTYRSRVDKKAAAAGIRAVTMSRRVSYEAFCRYIDALDAVLLGNEKSCHPEFFLHLLARKKRIFMPADSLVRVQLNQYGAGIHALEELAGQDAAHIRDFSPACLPEELAEIYQGGSIAAKWIKWLEETEEAAHE